MNALCMICDQSIDAEFATERADVIAEHVEQSHPDLAGRAERWPDGKIILRGFAESVSEDGDLAVGAYSIRVTE